MNDEINITMPLGPWGQSSITKKYYCDSSITKYTKVALLIAGSLLSCRAEDSFFCLALPVSW